MIEGAPIVKTSYPMSVTGEKAKFFLGLGLLVSLTYVSVLRQQQPTGLECAALLSLTLALFAFDYLKVSQFLSIVEGREGHRRSHEQAIQSALEAVLRFPLLLEFLRTEVLVLYYAFFANYERNGVITEHKRFGYAGSSNAHDVFLFVALSQLPFLPFIHVIIEAIKGPGPAWAVSLLTLWSVIWFLAQVEAVKFRPIELSEHQLRYRFGLVCSADIPLSTIKLARHVDVSETFAGEDLFLSPIGSKKNLFLEFDAPIQFRGPYRLKRREIRAAISVDDPAGLLRELALRGVTIA